MLKIWHLAIQNNTSNSKKVDHIDVPTVVMPKLQFVKLLATLQLSLLITNPNDEAGASGKGFW
jgi:hypothetical protein